MPTAPRENRRTDSPPACLRLGAGRPEARHVVMVPGTAVPLVRLTLPKGLRGQAREQVAQRQLADRAGLRADQRQGLLLRPCPPLGAKGKNSAQWHQALISDKTLLDSLQGLSCKAVLPDYMTLPTAAEIWTLCRDTLPDDPLPSTDTGADNPDVQEDAYMAGGNTGAPIVMARLGPEDGFTAQPALALAQLERALRAGPLPKAWLLLSSQTESDPLVALAAAHGIPVVHNTAELTRLGLPEPKILQHGELACDLRHNPMAARNQLERQLKPWRWPLLAGALAAMVWAATQVLVTARLQAETAEITARTTQMVQAHFVPQGPVLDARLQVSRALADLRQANSDSSQASDPLLLAARTARVLAQARQQPELLSYDETEGLLLTLRLADFAAVDQLQSAFDSAGLTTSLRDSRVSDGQDNVRAEFRITASTTPAGTPQTGTRP